MHIYSTITSKCFVIIRKLSLSIVYHTITTPQQEFINNNPISKYKTKVMPIVYIAKSFNTL